MPDIFPHLILGGVLLAIALILIGVPYVDSFLPENLVAKEADSASPVPALPVVERALETEQPEVPERPEQEYPRTFAA